MKKIIVTCDTEIGELGRYVDNPIDILIYGRIEGHEVGIKLISEMSLKRGVKVDFFLDPYPAEIYGNGEFKSIFRTLSREHFVHLHTHPSWKFDSKKIYMNQYTMEEQYEIIKYGIDKYQAKNHAF